MRRRGRGALFARLRVSVELDARGPRLEGVRVERRAGRAGVAGWPGHAPRGALGQRGRPRVRFSPAQGALFSGRGEEFSFRGGAEWGFTRSGDSPSETEQVREEEGRLRGTCASELGPPGRSCVAAGLREGLAG